MNTACEVCGNIGYKHLLVFCRDCKCSVVHQYCLDKVVFDASLADWFCYECQQRHSEVNCSTSLEMVSCERSPSHAHFGSTVHQSITKRVESARDAGPRKKSRKGKLNMTNKAHGGKESNVIDVLALERGKEGVRLQLNYRASNDLPQRSMAANVTQLSILQNDVVYEFVPHSSNDGCEEVLPCDGIKNIPSVREKSIDSVGISSSSQHDIQESSESQFSDCQKGRSCHPGKNVKMGATSSPSESGEEVPSEKELLNSDDVQALSAPDYVLSYRSYLSEAHKERLMAFIQEIRPKITVFVAVLRKNNVHPPGPFLGISRDYALAHFPHTSTNVTLQMPGKSKKWHPKFYKREASRKYMLMGQWLEFVSDNDLQEGDICLLIPRKGGRRSLFTVYLLCRTATHSRNGAGFQTIGPCPGGSSAKKASEVHNKEEPTHGEHVSLESDTHEIFPGCVEGEDYIIPCKNPLSISQKKIVEERVRAIQSDVPIYVAIMKNNNVGVAQKWMLELGVRYAAVHLPASGHSLMLQCMGKTWKTQMVIHNGRRWFLNGGWAKFALDNGLQVGDICLFELKKSERKLTMEVHIISRVQL